MIRILLSTKLGELRWSQADLARATGIRPSTINEYYHELTERVNLEHLDLICEVLNCDLSEIIVRVPTPYTMKKTRAGHALHKEDEDD
ncbi:MAG: helix-turn-helix transcriptional regulator [Clostridia bacterium]|nr:helix-turn-helix transcriptional regulator [Clostridia bacterium]